MNCANDQFNHDHADPLPCHRYSPIVGTIVYHEKLIKQSKEKGREEKEKRKREREKKKIDTKFKRRK